MGNITKFVNVRGIKIKIREYLKSIFRKAAVWVIFKFILTNSKWKNIRHVFYEKCFLPLRFRELHYYYIKYFKKYMEPLIDFSQI